MFICSLRVNAFTVIVTTGVGGNFFSPSSFTINPGDTVKWKWYAGHHNTSGVSQPTGAPSWFANLNSADTEFLYVSTVSGLYTYTCTHHSGMDGQFFVNGCNFPSKPVITSANGNTSCAGNSIKLSVMPQTGATYQWIKDNTTITGATADSFFASVTGNYKVQVNRCGVDSMSAIVPITIYSPPVASFTSSNMELSYNFTNISTPLMGCSYIWSFGDGSPDQFTMHVNHQFATAGSYSVRLIAQDLNTTCRDTVINSIQATGNIHSYIDNGYTLYPNPASKHVYLETNSDAAFILTNTSGKTIAVPIMRTKTGYSIKLEELEQGIYFLRININENSFVNKLIVIH